MNAQKIEEIAIETGVWAVPLRKVPHSADFNLALRRFAGRILAAERQENTQDQNELPRIVAGYEPLAEVFRLALEQAQAGKGKERHATAVPFTEQPSMADAKLLGVAGPAFQARKKILEAVKCCEEAPERAIADLLGAMVYAAMAVLVIEERGA